MPMHSWVVEACLLGVDASLALLFYKMYKSGSSASDQIKLAEHFVIDETLAATVQERPDHRIAYACIEGIADVHGEDKPLSSRYGSDVGVIRNQTFDELKSKRVNGSWLDYRDVVKSSNEEVPFCLRGEGSAGAAKVIVDDRSQVEMLGDVMSLTYDHFDPRESGVVSNVVDRLSGYVSKGFQTTEHMLKVGTALLGFGQVVHDQRGRLRLKAPSESDAPGARYLLTRQSKDEVARSLNRSTAFYRTLALFFGSMGALYLCYTVGWRLQKYYNAYRLRCEVRRLAANRAESSAVDGSAPVSEDAAEGTACVICLSRARSVVIMACRHVCTCLRCFEEMPEPKKCPVCRQAIADVMPVFLP